MASIGSGRWHRDEAFDRPIFPDWYRQQPEEVGQLLRGSGFEI